MFGLPLDHDRTFFSAESFQNILKQMGRLQSVWVMRIRITTKQGVLTCNLQTKIKREVELNDEVQKFWQMVQKIV